MLLNHKSGISALFSNFKTNPLNLSSYRLGFNVVKTVVPLKQVFSICAKNRRPLVRQLTDYKFYQQFIKRNSSTLPVTSGQSVYIEIQKLPKWTNFLPKKLIPYILLARLDRPTGIWLCVLPGIWSFEMAAYQYGSPLYVLVGGMAYILFGGAVFRSIGCTINDIFDQKYDRLVARTSNRPLASGVINNKQALGFLALQISITPIFLLFADWQTSMFFSACLLPISTYPLMKRITDYPQIYLALTFNWCIFYGWPLLTGFENMNWPICLSLYASAFIWTIVYDVLYAFQDTKDDIAAGVRSMANKLHSKSKFWIYSSIPPTTAFLALAGYLNGQSWIYYTFGCLGTLTGMMWAVYKVNIKDPKSCASFFRQTKIIYGILAIGIILDILAQKLQKEEE